MIFKRGEKFSHDLAVSRHDELVDKFRRASRSDYTVKIAYEDDLTDDANINFWSLPESETDNSDTEDTVHSSDPLDELSRKFPSIVRNADEGEFLSYKPSENDFSQSTLDEIPDRSDDDAPEEFLEQRELPEDDNDNN